MKKFVHFSIFILCFALSVCVNLPAFSQSNNSLRSEIETALTALETQADSPSKTARGQELRAAQQLLENTRELEAEAQSYKQAAEGEEATLANIYQQIEELEGAPVQLLPANIDERPQQLNQSESELLEMRNILDRLDAKKTFQANRANLISTELFRLQAQLDEKVSAPDSEDPVKALAAQAKATELRQKILTLQTELSTLPARQRITEAQIELANAEYDRLQTYVARLKLSVSENRVLSSQQIAIRAKEHVEKAQSTSPGLIAIAEESVRLAEKLLEITQNTARLGNISSQMNEVYQRVSTSSSTVERVLAAEELSDETAGLLRRVKSSLADTDAMELSLEKSEATRTDLQLRTILWEDRLQLIGRSMKPGGEFLMSQLPDANSAYILSEKYPDFVEDLQTLRRELLINLIDAARIDLERRAKTVVVTRETIQLTESVETRLDRRLIWLRTNDSSPLMALKNIPAGLAYIGSPSNWKAAGVVFKNELINSPSSLLFLVGIPVLLWVLRPAMQRRLSELAGRVGRNTKGERRDNFLVTPSALILSFLIAAPLALILVSAGSILFVSDSAPNFTQALSAALTSTGSLFFILFTFKVICGDNGLLGAHLGWSDQARNSLSKHLAWFTPVVSIMTFLLAMGLYENVPSLRYGLALIAFVCVSVAISVMAYLFFRPKGGVAASIVMETSASPRITSIFPILVLIPLLVGLAPLIGYFDTAIELQSRIFRTGILGLTISILYGLLLRTINVAHDRYLLSRAARRRHQRLVENQAKSEADQSGEARPSTPEPVDSVSLSMQIRKTLFTLSILVFFYGLWKLWGPLLPALGIAEDITLWQQTRTVNGEDVTRSVTLSIVLVSTLILVGSLIAARNVKAILELLAFDRLNLDSGTRYATVTIAGYILIGIGAVVSLGLLGLDWSKLQWIVAALGVGIGFGLQEIIANFISGIIILFERPVRVGDVVTINNLTGTVNNVKIRATTITDFDNREVLLPNKAIITGEVTNWTLNNAVTRIIINIGVAYGSDIQQVTQILTNVLEAHPDVLSDPPPTVFFMAHGDSSLNFEIRMFVSAVFQRLPATHDVNSEINAALVANNIEIPFPQRDINIKGDK